MAWTYRPHGKQGGGRVFATILGHYSHTFDDPLYRALVLRGLAWSAGEPVDRLMDVVTLDEAPSPSDQR
jgi:type 1 glutamine amidotransferase